MIETQDRVRAALNEILSEGDAEITPEIYGDTVEYVTLDTFFYLAARVEDTAADEQAELERRMEEGTTTNTYGSFDVPESWDVVAEMAKDHGWQEVVPRYWTGNHESALSSEIVYAIYATEDDDKDEYGCEYANSEKGLLLAVSRGEYFWTGDVQLFRVRSAYVMHDVASFDITLMEPEVEVDPRQGVLVEMSPRETWMVNISFRGNVIDDVSCHPWNDDRLEEVVEDAAAFANPAPRPNSWRRLAPFVFGVNEVVVAEDGQVRFADGPMAGWSIDFYAPSADY